MLDLDHAGVGVCQVEETANGIPGERNRRKPTEAQKENCVLRKPSSSVTIPRPSYASF